MVYAASYLCQKHWYMLLIQFLMLGRNLQVQATSNDACRSHTIDFIMIDGDASLLAVEDDIRADLEQVGITVNSRILSKEDYNRAKKEGDFHLAFSETWGFPIRSSFLRFGVDDGQ